MAGAGLTEFRGLWFPSPRIRLPELELGGPVHIDGGRCISGLLGEHANLWILAAGRGQGSFHGLVRLEDGRLCPISRDGSEDVFKSSWVMFSR